MPVYHPDQTDSVCCYAKSKHIYGNARIWNNANQMFLKSGGKQKKGEYIINWYIKALTS